MRVGIRRLAGQQSSMPPSVISNLSMHLGVLATASNAITTHTLFVVFYKPRFYSFSAEMFANVFNSLYIFLTLAGVQFNNLIL